MTEGQEHVLRIMGDPINSIGRLSQRDKTAIRVAMEERAELLAACEAYIAGIDSGNEPHGHIRQIHADMRAAVAKATGGQP